MLFQRLKLWSLGCASMIAAGPAVAAPVPGGIDFQPPMTETARNVQVFHNEVLIIITVITVFVTALLLWVIVRYNSRANPTPKKFSHNTVVEILWTVIPVLVLVYIARGSFPLLYEQDVFPTQVVMADGSTRPITEADITDVKIYGRQWFWSYIYGEGDEALEFDSNMVPADLLKPGQIDQLSVDNPMVVPQGRHIRLSITASDVIHSWAMPATALKVDAVPGRLNQLWFKIDEPGVYYGQCSELCGQRHAFMPIEMRVLPLDQYNTWLARATASVADGRAYLDEVQPLGGPQVAAAN
ncbi:MAG: cytochrome c oxidase subunit II [Alphaproteobacteria bacterium]|nr:cytochrome c oxidase subunit II [Alphaproteobacteria bacterium]